MEFVFLFITWIGKSDLMKKMNNEKTTMIKKPSTIIAAVTIIAVVASAVLVLVLGMQSIISQNALGQSNSSNIGSAANTTQSTNKEFWVKTCTSRWFCKPKRNSNETRSRSTREISKLHYSCRRRSKINTT